jgi:thiamine-phosphate pyrophosphorylase
MFPNKCLYLVTDAFQFSERRFFEIIELAVTGGVNCVQLREKNRNDADVIRLGKALKSILAPYSVPLIINDRVDLALAVSAEGVHLGQADGDVFEARRVLGDQAIIGLSLNQGVDLLKINALPVDYVAASPVFFTPTKKDITTPWGLDGLAFLCKTLQKPVVAIGGIQLGVMEAVLKTGVAGVACISEIMLAEDPEGMSKKLFAYFDAFV